MAPVVTTCDFFDLTPSFLKINNKNVEINIKTIIGKTATTGTFYCCKYIASLYDKEM